MRPDLPKGIRQIHSFKNCKVKPLAASGSFVIIIAIIIGIFRGAPQFAGPIVFRRRNGIACLNEDAETGAADARSRRGVREISVISAQGGGSGFIAWRRRFPILEENRGSHLLFQ